MEHKQPMDIEKTSFSIIEKELIEKNIQLKERYAPIIKRAIHTTADFDYAHTLRFSNDVISIIIRSLQNGAQIITDTNMALAGINKRCLHKHHIEAHCFMADADIIQEAKEKGVTRASLSMEKAIKMDKPTMYVIGNAPTALLTLRKWIDQGYRPIAVIGVPVGFVNVIEAKEAIMETTIPWIINTGRKGGSTVAAAIMNAILYQMDPLRGLG